MQQQRRSCSTRSSSLSGTSHLHDPVRYSHNLSTTSTRTNMEESKIEKAGHAGSREAAASKIQSLIEDNPVLVMGTSTCAFCIEAKRTLTGYGITEGFIDMDKREDGAEMSKALTTLLGGKTSVPQIWIRKQHVGGCDDLKALEAAGDLAIRLNDVVKHAHPGADAEAGALPSEQFWFPKEAAAVLYPGPDAAFFALGHSPATMDSRVVRLSAVISFFISVATAVFAKRDATQWVVLGLSIDFALRLLGFSSPVGLLARLPFAGTRPMLTAGASKQFASLCGTLMAFVAWAFLVGDQLIGAQIVLVVLAAAAALQGFLNFCVGCFIFGYLLKFGLVSRSDTLYAWERDNLRSGRSIATTGITYPTKGLLANPTDLRAKPRKEDEKRERFDVIAYCHVSYFMVPLSILGLAVPWALLSDTVDTACITWQVIAWAGVVLHFMIGFLYLAKVVLYTKKVCKEWTHPIQGNSFALPFMNFLVMAWLASRWEAVDWGDDLARVMFWVGSGPLALVTLFFIARWICRPTDPEYVNPSWMLIPLANLVGALAARPVDIDYLEWGWCLFSIGVLVWLALWPLTFGKSIGDHHSDFRLRSFYAIWMAAPAISMLSYASLMDLDSFDAVQRVLFYSALSLALVLAVCSWPLDFFLEGKFDMSDWGFAFPLDIVAAAAVMAYSYTRYDTMQVIYVIALAVACIVNSVCALSTLAALKARHVFNPMAKWSPLSFMKLTHEAFREAIPKLEKIAASAKPEVASAASLRDLCAAWETLRKMHDVHSRHEEEVIFPALECFFPGQTSLVHEEHEAHEELMEKIQSLVDFLLSSDVTDVTARATLLSELRTTLHTFGEDMLQHLDHEEHAYATPVARKFLPVSTVKDIVRESWDTTPPDDMSDFIGWAMSTLRSRGMRTRFIKTWVWAMPERAQQLGLMLYRVVDDVRWVEIARSLPEIVPRGLPGHRRYY